MRTKQAGSADNLLGKVFKQHGINLIYGESGIGKTISTIKALNSEDIIPILLDFDDNESPETNDCSYIHVNGNTALNDPELVLPTGAVIIVDTWAHYCIANKEANKLLFLNRLVEATNTVILVAHNKDIATKKDIPDVDQVIVNHLSSKLWLERKGTYKKEVGHIHSILHIYKCRGYKGPISIANWMRDK